MTNLQIIENADRLATTDLSNLSGAQLTFAVVSNLELLGNEAKLIRKTIKHTDASTKYYEELTKLSNKYNATSTDNGFYTFKNKEDADQMALEKDKLDLDSKQALDDIEKLNKQFEEVLKLENTNISDKIMTVKLSDISDEITASQMAAIKFMIKN